MKTTEPSKQTWRRDGVVRGLLGAALLLAVAFGAVHLLGLRPYTSVLCGSIPQTAQSLEQAVFFGVLYAAGYFTFVVGTPILLIAVPVYLTLKRCFRVGKPGRSGCA